jgi:hypothetical protein
VSVRCQCNRVGLTREGTDDRVKGTIVLLKGTALKGGFTLRSTLQSGPHAGCAAVLCASHIACGLLHAWCRLRCFVLHGAC